MDGAAQLGQPGDDVVRAAERAGQRPLRRVGARGLVAHVQAERERRVRLHARHVRRNARAQGRRTNPLAKQASSI